MSRKPIDDLGDPNVEFDEDNPEWTAEDFARAKPASELPPEILAAFPNTLRHFQEEERKKQQAKVPVSLRLSREVIEHFKATGAGWQARIDETLKEAIAKK
jgi:uncharacterized protein (DUF4415 family)